MKDVLKRFLAVASLVGLPCLALAQSPDQPSGAGQPDAAQTENRGSSMGQAQLNWAICPSPKSSLRGTQGSLDNPAGSIDRSGDLSGSGDISGGSDTTAKSDEGMTSDDLHRDMSGSPSQDQSGQQDQPGVGAMTSPMGGDLVTQIENSLSENKLYKKGVSPNGVLDKADFDAIKKFQTSKKISPATGCIDQQTLDVLGVSIDLQTYITGGSSPSMDQNIPQDQGTPLPDQGGVPENKNPTPDKPF
jgi:hypothetical protein